MSFFSDFFDFDEDPFYYFDMPYRRYLLENKCRHGACAKKHHGRKSIRDYNELMPSTKLVQRLSGFGRMDLHESSDTYSLSLDLPGMSKDEINVTTDEGKLIIEGERQTEYKNDEEDGTYHFVERHSGSFRRELSIPKDADATKINAVYDNGVLKVTMPKTGASSNVRRITVNYECLLTKLVLFTFIDFEHWVGVITQIETRHNE